MTVTVLACADKFTEPGGLRAPPGGAVHVIDELCLRPKQIAATASGADRLVLVLCRHEYAPGHVQTQIRKAGLDPFGVEIVDIAAADSDPERLELLVAAAAARAQAFEGSSVASAKPTFPGARSRRTFLTFPPPEYVAVPTTDPALCAVGVGCDICIDACPQQAIRVVDGRIERDISACGPCGICVTVCPAQATSNPTVTPAQIQAQIGTLADHERGPGGPRQIIFTCRRATDTVVPDGWYPVEVPCTGMVPAVWLLGALGQGADRVAASPCAENGCPLGNDDRLLPQIEFCRTFLEAAGVTPELVGALPSDLDFEPPAPLAIDSFETYNPYGGFPGPILLAIVQTADAPADLVVEHPASPVGLVAIDAEACTGCEACVRACPSSALSCAKPGRSLTIELDTAACVACRQCERTCPERRHGAIRVLHEIDIGRLAAGSVELVRKDVNECLSCGAPIAPGPLLETLRERLGPEHAKTAELIEHYCSDCRASVGPGTVA